MTIWDEIKMAWFLKNLPGQIKNTGVLSGGSSKMMAKISALFSKLDGLKSVLGLLMIVGYYVGPQFGITVPEVVLKIGTGFASVGLAMKLEKGLGFLTTVISYAGKVLSVLQAVVNALAPKAPQA